LGWKDLEVDKKRVEWPPGKKNTAFGYHRGGLKKLNWG